jgi:hypothetical protein
MALFVILLIFHHGVIVYLSPDTNALVLTVDFLHPDQIAVSPADDRDMNYRSLLSVLFASCK